VDVSWSPLMDLLPPQCTLELQWIQAELSVQHSLARSGAAPGNISSLWPANHATKPN
jgi:hypothetical protein